MLYSLYVVQTTYIGFIGCTTTAVNRIHVSNRDVWSWGATGYEVTSNKTSDISSNASSTTKYPTTKGVADYAEAKMAIVAASGTTLTASVDNYYLFSSEVDTLAITLTTPSDTTHITKSVFMLTTGSSPAVTFAGASGINVIAQDGFSIEASTTYEINAIFNGTAWVVAAMKLSSTPINS